MGATSSTRPYSALSELTLPHLRGADFAPPPPPPLNNSVTPHDIKTKFFKFNLTLWGGEGVILHMVTILIALRCFHAWQPFVMNVSQNGKCENLHIWQDISLILLKSGNRGYCLDSKSKTNNKILI